MIQLDGCNKVYSCNIWYMCKKGKLVTLCVAYKMMYNFDIFRQDLFGQLGRSM